MDDNDKRQLLSMLALARKAGRLAAGEESCLKAIRDGSAFIVFLAVDASDNTRKKFNDKAAFYNANILSMFTKDDIGIHVGLYDRAALAVTDESFANKMKQIITRSGT